MPWCKVCGEYFKTKCGVSNHTRIHRKQGLKKQEKAKSLNAINFRTSDSKNSDNADVKEKATENKRINRKLPEKEVNVDLDLEVTEHDNPYSPQSNGSISSSPTESMESDDDECINIPVPIAISSLSLAHTKTKVSSSKDDSDDSQSTYEYSGQPLPVLSSHEETLAISVTTSQSNISSLKCTDNLSPPYEFSGHGQIDAYPVSNARNLWEHSKIQEKIFPDYSVNRKLTPVPTSTQLVSQEVVKLHQQSSNRETTSTTKKFTSLMTPSLPLSKHDSQFNNRCLDALTRLNVRSLLNSMTSFIASEFQTSGIESSIKSKNNANLQFPNQVISPLCLKPDPVVISSTSSMFCNVKTSEKENMIVPTSHSNATSGEKLQYQPATNNNKSTVELVNQALPSSSNCLRITDPTERIYTRKQKTQSKLDDCIPSSYQNMNVKQEMMTESSSDNSFNSISSHNTRSNEIKILEKIFPLASFPNNASANTAVSTTLQLGDRNFKEVSSRLKQEISSRLKQDTTGKTTSFSLVSVSTRVTSPLFSRPKFKESSRTTSIPTLSTPITSIPNFQLLIPYTLQVTTESQAHHQSLLQQLLSSVVTKEGQSKQPSNIGTHFSLPVETTPQMHQNPCRGAVGNQRYQEMFERPSLPVSLPSTNLSYKSPLSLTETINSFIRPQRELSSELSSLPSAENICTKTNPLPEQFTKEPVSLQETPMGDDNRQVVTSASSNRSKDSVQIQNIMVLTHSDDGVPSVRSKVKNIQTATKTNVNRDLKTWILSQHQRDRMKELLSSSLCHSSNPEKHSDGALCTKQITSSTIKTMHTQENANHSCEPPNPIQKDSNSTDTWHNQLAQQSSKQPIARTLQLYHSLASINQNQQKEAIALVMDIGPTMNTRLKSGDIFLQISKDIVSKFLQQKRISSCNDEISLILFGTPATVHPYADDIHYQNITIINRLGAVNLELLDLVQNSIEPTSISADFLDALIVALNHLRDATKSRSENLKRRIILLSDLGGHCKEEQSNAVIKKVKDLCAELNFIGPFDTEKHGKSTVFGEEYTLLPRQQAGGYIISNILLNVAGTYLSFKEALSKEGTFQTIDADKTLVADKRLVADKTNDADKAIVADKRLVAADCTKKCEQEIKCNIKMSLRTKKGETEVMARTKTSVINKDDDKKKKEIKKTDEAKKTPGKNINSSDGSKQDSSESEDEMFSNMDKRDSGIPKFIKGTTWPLDTSVEVTVNYDAAKELRSVKKEFYPLLYHMTRADPRQMSNCICRSKVLLSYVKARVEQDERSKDRNRTRHLISQKEIRSLGVEDRPDSPMKLRKTFTSAAVASSITDLTDAKTEVLKLLARVSLKRQDFAKLLVWIQKLKLCGKEGHGRWGEVYVKDTTLESSSTDVYRYNSSDSEGDIKPSKFEKGHGKQVGRGGVGRGRGGGGRRGTNQRNRSPRSGDKRNTTSVRNWKVALRQNTPQRSSESPELAQRHMVQKKMSETPEQVQYTSLIKSSSVSLAGSKKALSSPPASSKTLKLNTYELKGKTLCKKEIEKKKSIVKKKDAISPCSIPIVDVMSVLDKKEISVLDKRIKDKHKPRESKSQYSGRGQSRRRHLSHKEGKSVKSRISDEDDEDEDELVPYKKHRQSTDPEVPIPVCLYRADENENLSSPIVEIDNVENGVCVPYEDRFVQKAEEEQRLLTESLLTGSNVNIIPGHLSASALGIQLNMPKFGMPLSASNIQSAKVPITSAGRPQINVGQLGPFIPPSNIAQGTSHMKSPPPPYTTSSSIRHVPPPQYNRVPFSSTYNSITSTLPPQNATLINTSSSTATSESPRPAADITTMINANSPNNSQLIDTRLYPNVQEAMPTELNISKTHLKEQTSQNTQERVKIKEENSSGFLEKNVITTGLVSINDGITVNFSRKSMAPLDSSFGQHEPTSSTNDNDNDKNSVKQEPSMDYVVVKNEESVFISLDSDDDDNDETEVRNISNNAKKNTTNIDDQKEADPIIVIDD